LRNFNYILNEDGKPIPEPDILKWAEWMGREGNKRIAQTEINGFWISTIFLGIDHSFIGGVFPILFETLVFTKEGKALEETMQRYSSKTDAIEGHKKVENQMRKQSICAVSN
jgi:hypothetical protein